MSIFVERSDVEIGIRGHEIEHIVFLFAEPVFPSDVPAFDKELIKTVGGSKIYISAYIFVVRSMTSVRFGLRIVECGKVENLGIGIVPSTCTGYHLPPYAHIFGGMDPRHVLKCARVVEIKREI